MILFVVVTLPMTGVVSPVAAAATHPRTRTFITIDSQPGDPLGGGVPRAFFPSNSSIRISGSAYGFGLIAEGGTSGSTFVLNFQPTSVPACCEEGFYENTRRLTLVDAKHSGMQISRESRFCDDVTGRFEISTSPSRRPATSTDSPFCSSSTATVP